MKKKYYAISPVSNEHVTAGKKYECLSLKQGSSFGRNFSFTSDNGSIYFTCEKASLWLDLNNWQIVEEPVSQYPKVMWVSNESLEKAKDEGRKRVVFMEKQGRFLAWVNAETIKGAESYVGTKDWKYAVDIEEEKPTTEEICQKIVELKAGTVSFMAQFAMEKLECEQYIKELRQQLTVDDPEATRRKLGDEISDLIINGGF